MMLFICGLEPFYYGGVYLTWCSLIFLNILDKIFFFLSDLVRFWLLLLHIFSLSLAFSYVYLGLYAYARMLDSITRVSKGLFFSPTFIFLNLLFIGLHLSWPSLKSANSVFLLLKSAVQPCCGFVFPQIHIKALTPITCENVLI